MKEPEINKGVYPFRALPVGNGRRTVYHVIDVPALKSEGVFEKYDDAYREAEYRNKIYWGART